MIINGNIEFDENVVNDLCICVARNLIDRIEAGDKITEDILSEHIESFIAEEINCSYNFILSPSTLKEIREKISIFLDSLKLV